MTYNDRIKIYKKLTNKKIDGIKDFNITCHEGLNSLKINFIEVQISLLIQIIDNNAIQNIKEKVAKVLDSIPLIDGFQIKFEKINSDIYTLQKIKYPEDKFEYKLIKYRDYIIGSVLLRFKLFHIKYEELVQYMEEIQFDNKYYIEYELLVHPKNCKQVSRSSKLIELTNNLNYEDNVEEESDEGFTWDI